jgi:predicted GNAT superfamily acetyltransferase
MTNLNIRQCVPELENDDARHHRMLPPASEDIESFDSDNANIEVRSCRTHEELDECVRLQQRVWQFNDLDSVPRRVFIVTTNIGGVVLGAYASHNAKPLLLGFVWALPGVRHEANTQVYIHAEMMAVHPNASNHRIAQRLMLAMREYARSQNIYVITSNFDPTDSKLAHLYIDRYGGIARRYTAHYYGLSSSPLHKLPTDRLHVEWWVDSLNLKQQQELLSSKSDHIKEVHVPAKTAEWKRIGDAQAVKVQQAICDELTTAFEQGFVILGFRLEQDGSGVYQLGCSTRTEKNK